MIIPLVPHVSSNLTYISIEQKNSSNKLLIYLPPFVVIISINQV